MQPRHCTRRLLHSPLHWRFDAGTLTLTLTLQKARALPRALARDLLTRTWSQRGSLQHRRLHLHPRQHLH